MTTALDRIVDALEAHSQKVRRIGTTRARSTAPCHAGDNPDTLSIMQQGERARIHCFKGCDDTDVLDAIGLQVRDLFDNQNGVTYPYRGVDGARLYSNKRYVNQAGKKAFYNDKSKTAPDAPNVLYRLPEAVAAVAAGRTIYVCEGEADAEAAVSVGLDAVATPGADRVTDHDWTPLHGATRVVVVQHHDKSGHGFATTVRGILDGHVDRLDVVRAKTGNDLSDHLTAGHDVDELVEVDLVPRPARMLLQRASSVRTERQVWVWADRMPADTPSIFAGRGGEGKTTYALHLGAQLTRGILPGEYAGTPRDLLIWSGEDRAETVLVPRLEAAGADLNRVHIVSGVEHPDEGTTAAPRFPADTAALEAAIVETGAVLVIVDPLTSTTAGDLHKVADVRATLDALAGVTRRTGAVVLGITHFNKGSGNAGDKLTGSHAFRDAVRSLFLFATDDETGHRIVTQEKNNYAENMAASLAFDLESTPVETDDGETVHVARVVELGESDVSVQDLINRTAEDEDQRADRNEAQAWLLDHLSNRPDYEAPAGDVIRAAQKDGFNAQQIKDARRRCRDPRIVSQRAAFTGGWVWSLDESEGGTETPQGGEGGEEGNPRPSRHLAATLPPTADEVAHVASTDQASPPSPPSPPSSETVPPCPADLESTAQIAQLTHTTGADSKERPAQRPVSLETDDRGRLLCPLCGKPNMFAPVSIERGYCDGCRKALVPPATPMPGTDELNAIA